MKSNSIRQCKKKTVGEESEADSNKLRIVKRKD